MIRIQQLKMKPGHSRKALIEKAARTLHIKPEQIAELEIAKQSIDARKKPEIFFSYVADVRLKDVSEEKCVQRCRDKNVSLYVPKAYCFPTGEMKNSENVR